MNGPAERRVLVTGAGGFVGRRLCTLLAAQGWRVRGTTRSADSRSVADLSWSRVPDIGPATDWSAALKDVDAVVHLAARVHVMRDGAADPLAEFRKVNALGTRRLAEAAADAGIRRFVYLSSIKVNGEATPADRPFGADDPPAPADPYGVSKLEAERALAEIARDGVLEPVILRPPLVYGPGVGANFRALLGLCARGWPLPLGGVENRRSLLFVGNLADAIARALVHPAAPGRTWLISDGEDVSTPDLIRRIAGALGRPARLPPVPPGWLRVAGRLTGRASTVARLLDSLVVDGAPIRGELGWTPPYSMDAGLAETAAWYRDRHG